VDQRALKLGICASALVLSALAIATALPQSLREDPAQPASFVQSVSSNAAPQPPRVLEAQRFLAQRGFRPGHARGGPHRLTAAPQAHPASAATAAWQPIGPTAVVSQNYGLVSGRVSALALDPSDPTGNSLYAGATGGGVWFSQNAGAGGSSAVVFTPLTDTLTAVSGAANASISIGALTVQPGATGVLLAGTGDPNDALDSYYGAGILRSADGGNTWSLITETADSVQGNGFQYFSFVGEGFAGFAWSTVNPELVVAAVSQALEGTLVNAGQSGTSYEGLYYSTDSGATWHLSTITDGAGMDVQGPNDVFTPPDGNAATSVIWNPIRKLFIAAVRYHGYYQSANGVTWTRVASQPGSGLTTAFCPTNPGTLGSTSCPIFRGTLAVNPQTGDTFAWTVDDNNQDQGIFQDKCELDGGVCGNPSVDFTVQWNTTALETSGAQGPAAIANGDYDLALAAVPSTQDTLLFAGGNDLWKCSLAAGCAWRNTTNFNTCMSAQVAGYQHALAWNTADPLEIFLGNDSGLWRSTDAIAETGVACASTDFSHFQNLNGGLGSLAEVTSLAQASTYTMMAGLGVNGAAGVKSGSTVSHWPQILGGVGGPAVIDYGKTSNWYVNNSPGVSIHLCSQATGCTPSAFGASPLINNADVDNDGLAMGNPAPFLVDPFDRTQLLIATCRVWRGPASGVGWSTGNALSPILDGNASNVSCNGDPLIRSIAALATSATTEVIYAGMFGAVDGGFTLPGHIFSAVVTPGSATAPVWHDLTSNPVTNSTTGMNSFGFDISSIFIDPHDTTGKTVYVTVEGFFTGTEPVETVYGSTDGGAHWQALTSNLLPAPANSIVVDPQDPNTVYVATDIGVFSTRQISSCATPASSCWTQFGSALPESPVVQLSAIGVAGATGVLTAATYGRGLWQVPLWTASVPLTTATVQPTSLTFAKQKQGTTSNTQTVTLSNSGSAALNATISVTGDFSETDNCQTAAIAAGSACSIQVEFTPTATGTRTGLITIVANVSGGQLTVPLSGTGNAAAPFSVTPSTIDFGEVATGSTSSTLPVSVSNAGGSSISISSTGITGQFQIASNTCGNSVPAQTACQIEIDFAPTQTGSASGALTLIDTAGTQTVDLSGTGANGPTDTLSTKSLTLPNTVEGQQSTAANVVLTNNGDLSLTSIAATISGNFQFTQNCGTILPGHSSCAFSLVFAPAQVGSQSGSLVISDALRNQTVLLSGTGLEPPVFTVVPAKLTFQPQEIGVTSGAMTLNISNTGGAPMANVSFQPIGQSATSYAVSSTTCGAKLSNGSSCTAKVTFTPSATGSNAATLIISSSTPGVSAASVPLSGTGLAPPQLSVEPPILLFNSIVVGASSTAQQVVISNSGGVAITDMRLAVTGDYSFSAGNCTAVLASLANCTASVTFTPTATGSRLGVFTISSVSGAATPATVSLQGTGIAPSAIVPSSSTLAFGSLLDGQTSPGKSLTIYDVGTAALNGLSLTVSGPFALQKDNCGASLAASQSCSTQLVFAPLTPGAQTGSLTIASTTQWIAPVVVTLTGTGLPAPVLQVSPLELTFGSVLVGAMSSPLTVTVSDPGGASLAGLTLQASGDFSLANNTCPATLASGASCTTQVIFAPSIGGARSGALNISSTSPGTQPITLQLSGTGEAPGSLTGNPSNLLFGSLPVGQSSAAQSAIVENSGQVTANGLAFRLTGDYALQSSTCGTTLAGGASCTLFVVFSPTATGDRTGTLSVSSTTSGVGPAVIVLDGQGVPPGYLMAAPSSVTFPDTPVGGASSPLNVVLSDPGIAAVTGLQAQTAGDFSATLCATTLPSQGRCTIKVVFSPTAPGARSGQLTVTTTSPGATPAVVALAGTGTLPPSLTLSASTLSFPATPQGQTSAAQTIVVANPSAVELETPHPSVTGDFHIASDGCSGPLLPQGSCNISIDFAPTAAGGRSGALTVTSATALVKPVTATLSGVGLVPAAIGVSPLSLDFPVVLTGQSSAVKTVTIANTGGSPMTAPSLTLTPQFGVTANTCLATLAAGAACTAGIVFEPIQQGPVTGGLTITSPSVSTPAGVSLSGTGGAPPGIVVKPAVINFPTTGVGLASSPQQVTVSNTGTVTALTGLTLSIGSGFRLVSNACTSVLAPMQSCTTGIEFAPAAPGTAQSTLAVSAATVQGAAVTLMGTGFDFTVTPSGATSVTVASGETASYALTIKVLGGGQGVFTFQCGALPASTLCQFNPTQETVTSNATGFVTVELATGQSVSSSARASAPWRILPIACGVLLLPFALRRRRRRPLLLALLLAFAVAGVSSCISASGGSKPSIAPSSPGSTPPSTYLVPVTILANGVHHQVTLTLTVD
jgi:hypothetical protein